MWRRALLAAAAVSYLICVLIMSGMQKEDLDVSMLRKLQRYNVNIDDINNEQLRQQCFSRNNGYTIGIKNNKKNDDYVSTTEQNKSRITTKSPLPVVLNMDTVLNYLKARQDSVTNLDETTPGKTTRVPQELITTIAEGIENQPKIDADLLRRYIQLETQKKSLYKIDDNSESTKRDRTIYLKTNDRIPTIADDAAIIDKLFKDYSFQTQDLLTTTEHTTRFTIDILNIYKQIDEIMAIDSNAENIENNTFIFDKAGQSSTKPFTNPVAFFPLNQNKSYLARSRLLKSFYNFLSEMKQFKNNSGQMFSFDNVNSKVEPYILNQREIYKETTTYKSKSEIEPDQKVLPPNLVKEIAETVKDVIIKDLREELAGINLKTTQTTTESVPTTTKTTTTTTEKITLTTTYKSRTQEGDLSIMDKFMELYEQIKSLKQATFLLRANNESETLVNQVKQEIKYPARNPVFMPLANRLQIPDTRVFISSIGKYNTKQFFNQDPYIPLKENNHAVPITIQTNSVEIQPLAVPISKPQTLIRQNIIVDPGYRIQDHPRPKQISVRGNRYSDIQTTHKNRTYKYAPVKQYEGYNSARYPLHAGFQEPKHREDIIRFRMRGIGNSRLDTDYYEKINFENDHSGQNVKHGSFRNRNIPRFHERLERVDTGSDGIPFVYNKVSTDKQEPDNMDVPSRQQLSLIDMKKGSAYNDSHFKNFLKTQQKVTDMLERILATRPKTNTPRSVEAV